MLKLQLKTKKLIFHSALGVVMGLIMAKPAWATIQVNEIMPNPSGGDNYWVVLYNDGDGAVDLTGWTLTNKDGVVKTLDSSEDLGKHDFRAYNIETELLKNSGDTIVLKDKNGDQQGYTFGYGSDPGQGVTLGRWPDGASGWLTMKSATKGAANSGPEPTATPTPENTPTPTVTPTPKVSPTDMPTPTTAKSQATPTQSANDEPSEVDQLRNQVSSDSPQSGESGEQPEASQSTEKKNSQDGGVDWLALGLIGGGGVFLAGAGWMVWKGRKRDLT